MGARRIDGRKSIRAAVRDAIRPGFRRHVGFISGLELTATPLVANLHHSI
jgi:hypothetical protein